MKTRSETETKSTAEISSLERTYKKARMASYIKMVDGIADTRAGGMILEKIRKRTKLVSRVARTR